MKDRLFSLGSACGGVGAAVMSAAASICCAGPLGIAILGVNGAILAAGIKPWRPYLLAASFLFIAVGFWFVYGRDRARSGAECSVRVARWTRVTRVVLWAAAAVWLGSVVLGVLADRYWL